MRSLLLVIAVGAVLFYSVQAEIFHVNGEFTFWDAHAACKRQGAALATKDDLKDHQENGYEMCSCGWLSDRSAAYPMASAVPGCGDKAGIHVCDWKDTWNAYCIGYEQLPNCTQPFGLEDGSFPGELITATTVNSAFWGPDWLPGLARLNKEGYVNAWMPNHDGRNQYIQLEFPEYKALTGIVTQGASRYWSDQFVNKFKVTFSTDLRNWSEYENGKIFYGNYDDDSHVRNWFNPPILGMAVRVYPYSWHTHISLRLELFGCNIDEYTFHKEIRQSTKG